jgi:hypothetical protein
MSLATKERKRSGQIDDESVTDETLLAIGMKDYLPDSFKSRAMEMQDLTSLYRLKLVAHDTFLRDNRVLAKVMQIIDQRIESV